MASKTLEMIADVGDRKNEHSLKPFHKFVEDDLIQHPEMTLRNIFQFFDDMVHHYVTEKRSENLDESDSIDFKVYDTSRLLEDSDEPFFADRIFANRFVKMADSMRSSAKQNKVYIFEGPAGSGKTVFIDNVLSKLEEYSRLDEGRLYETVWKIDPMLLKDSHQGKIGFTTESGSESPDNTNLETDDRRSVIIPCPNHSHPFLHIKKDRRSKFLDSIIEDEEVKRKIFNNKEYEWIFKDDPSPISSSIFEALLEKTGDLKKVFSMLYARRYTFERKTGHGINVFNAGDRQHTDIKNNEFIQKQLNRILRDSTLVNYMHSSYANSNNGIYVIMDLKDNNKRRLTDLHGIISDGVKRVDNMEESISSIFFVTKNLEDNVNEAEDMRESFRDRVELLPLNRIVDYRTEVKIYRKTFGDSIVERFHPGVLDTFAKAIVSTRLKDESEAIDDWIDDPSLYQHRCDSDMKILKMELYSGIKPNWLTREDFKEFSSDAEVRRSITKESQEEGLSGYSVRKSINELNSLLEAHSDKGRGLSIDDVFEYLSENLVNDEDSGILTEDFLISLVDSYKYDVLDEIKDSMFSYNEDEMYNDIIDYLVALTSEKDGQELVSPFTGKKLRITEDYLAAKEEKILGPDLSREERIESMYRYRDMLAKDIAYLNLEGKKVSDHLLETELYKELMDNYKSTAREHVLDDLIAQDSFIDAIKSYGERRFRIYDDKLKESVTRLMENMKGCYGYTQEGAKDVCSNILSDRNILYSTLFSDSA
ncbi:MAG: hypothetical protein ACLFSL_03850 [Candidatus Woesearchaeota archaeon]